MLENLQKKRRILHYIVPLASESNEKLYIELSAHPLREEESSAVSGVEGIFRDVTRRIVMQRELKSYSTNLEQVVAEKTKEIIQLERKKFNLEKLATMGTTAATIAHEIRNPLSSVKLSLTTLQKRAKMDPSTEDCLDMAVEEVDYLERILSELLDFAKPEELKLISCNINDIIGISLGNLRMKLAQENVEVEKELARDLPQVSLDPDQLTKALCNVLINACQAAGHNGSIRIRSQPDSTGKRVCVAVSDNGRGMDQDTLNNIFTPFFSKKSEGTGLGMTVVEKVINGHNGTIDISSRPAEGTTVTFSLPVSGWDA